MHLASSAQTSNLRPKGLDYSAVPNTVVAVEKAVSSAVVIALVIAVVVFAAVQRSKGRPSSGAGIPPLRNSAPPETTNAAPPEQDTSAADLDTTTSVEKETSAAESDTTTAEEAATPAGRDTSWEYGWYTPIVKPLRWLRWSTVGQRLPAWILNPLVYVIQHIFARLDHRSHVSHKDSEDPTWLAINEFAVPPDEHVAIPSLFLVELFPPSSFKQLKRAIKRNQWYAAQLGLTPVDPQMLEKARSGPDSSWWLLGAVARRKGPSQYVDARRTKMPKEFDTVLAKAFQIGHGITAVVARFYLSAEGAKSVDSVWHKLYEPEFVWGRPWAWSRAETAQFAAIRHTQQARQSIHSAARNWLRGKAPGVFAANDEPQPLVDILLFNQREANIPNNPSSQEDDAYRALGLTSYTTIQTSEQLPGFNLDKTDATPGGYLDERRTWALWGQRQAVQTSASNRLNGLGIRLDAYGNNTDDALAAYVSDDVENYLLKLSVSEILAVFNSRYSKIRDRAATRYKWFHVMKHLKELRSDLVTLSMNISGIEEDIRDFIEPNGRFQRAPIFTERSASWMEELDKARGRSPRLPINSTQQMAENQSRVLNRLASIDKRYREILTAAASLTSSMRAVRVSTASLAVATLAFLLSDGARRTILGAMLNKAWAAVWTVVATLAVAVGCSETPPYHAPQSFVVSDEGVTKVAEDAIMGDSKAAQLGGSPVVKCTPSTCTITYTVQKSPGFDSDAELLYPTRQIWKALFTDPKFQSGTMNISGPVTTVGGKSETAPLLTLTCDRDALSQIDWDKIDGDGFRTLCGFVAHSAGLPGGPTTGPLW